LKIPQDFEEYQRASFGINKREILSEHDHYESNVKRKNFISLFLDGYEADKYIATHMYGDMHNINGDASLDKIELFFETSALKLNSTFDARARIV